MSAGKNKKSYRLQIINAKQECEELFGAMVSISLLTVVSCRQMSKITRVGDVLKSYLLSATPAAVQ